MKSNKSNEALFRYIVLGESEPLVSMYSWLIKEYVSIICKKDIDYYNKRHKEFVSLYISSKKIRSQLFKGVRYLNKETYDEVKKILNILSLLFRGFTEKEVYNELLIPFLEISKKYKEMGIGFDSFIKKSINIAIKDYLSEMSIDIVCFSDKIDNEVVSNERFYINDSIIDSVKISTYDCKKQMELSDIRFIRGKKDTSGIFSDFSVVDRLILVYYYDLKMTDKLIGVKLSMHPSSVQRRRKQLVGFLAKNTRK